MMNVKQILTMVVMLIIGSTAVKAQNALFIDTLYHDSSDLEAQANTKYDYEGNPYALLKISLPLPEVKVAENSDVKDPDYKEGEIWVYLTATEDYGAQEVTLRHKNYHPLTIRFADYGIEPKGRNVYRMSVSVPTALFSEATNFYNNLKFARADSIFRLSLTDESTSAAERRVVEARLKSLPEAQKLNRVAMSYARRYIKLRKSGEVSKQEITNVVDSAVYWYNLLVENTSIPKAKDMLDQFLKIKAKFNDMLVLTGLIDRVRIKGQGMRVQMKRKKLTDVRVTVQKTEDESTTVLFDTNDDGTFNVQLSASPGMTLQFRHDDYVSNTYTVAGDKRMHIVLTKKD